MTRSSGDSSLLRQLNSAAVLRALLAAPGALTVAELARAVGVSRPPAEQIVADLVRARWAEEEPPLEGSARTVGRPARRYRFRADAGSVLGIDIGAHKTLAVTADLRGAVLATRRLRLDPVWNADRRLAAVRRNALACVAQAGTAPEALLAAGIGSTGVIDGEGRVALSQLLPEWTGLDLAGAARGFLPCPVLVDNDIRLGALAEHWRGAARGVPDVVLLHAGRRLSAGVVIGGLPRRGAHGAAGEIGNLASLDWAHSFERFDGRHRSAGDGDPGGGDPGDAARRVFAALRDGDRRAGYLVDAFARELAEGLAAMVLALDPDVVVIGGGLSRAGELLAEPVRRHLGSRCLFPPKVVASELGDEAVALGAVRLALTHMETGLLSNPMSEGPKG